MYSPVSIVSDVCESAVALFSVVCSTWENRGPWFRVSAHACNDRRPARLIACAHANPPIQRVPLIFADNCRNKHRVAQTNKRLP